MSLKYELTDSPPPVAFQKMEAPLVKFNEAAVGNATARTLAVLLKDPKTDELIGGLWAWSLWVLCTSQWCLYRSHSAEL